MRWSWIDRILEVEKGRRLVAIKNISLAEEVLHDHFPAQVNSKTGKQLDPLPIMPNSLLIEGMAQTAGLLVGQANDFEEKVILGKVVKAVFQRDVLAGATVRFEATIERMDPTGANTAGVITVIDHKTGASEHVADIELVFSHIDKNMTGTEFPKDNFVFTDNFRTLLKSAGMI